MKSHKIYKIWMITAILAMIAAFNVYAVGLRWNGHNAPFSFFFDNHIDPHQQSMVSGRQDKLVGFFYIAFTGGATDGLPNAGHGTDTVGWLLNGVPVFDAILLEKTQPHPTWCIDPEYVPRSRGYTHFHWLGNPASAEDQSLKVGDTRDGYLLKLTAVDSFYFEHGPFPITPGIDYDSHYNIVIDENNDGCADY